MCAMTDPQPQTTQWAKDIIMQMEDVRDHMEGARALMRGAATMIDQDNDEAGAAEDIIGALNLSLREINIEINKWIGYAAHRIKDERPRLVP